MPKFILFIHWQYSNMVHDSQVLLATARTEKNYRESKETTVTPSSTFLICRNVCVTEWQSINTLSASERHFSPGQAPQGWEGRAKLTFNTASNPQRWRIVKQILITVARQSYCHCSPQLIAGNNLKSVIPTNYNGTLVELKMHKQHSVTTNPMSWTGVLSEGTNGNELSLLPPTPRLWRSCRNE